MHDELVQIFICEQVFLYWTAHREHEPGSLKMTSTSIQMTHGKPWQKCMMNENWFQILSDDDYIK